MKQSIRDITFDTNSACRVKLCKLNEDIFLYMFSILSIPLYNLFFSDYLHVKYSLRTFVKFLLYMGIT